MDTRKITCMARVVFLLNCAALNPPGRILELSDGKDPISEASRTQALEIPELVPWRI